MSNGKSIVNVVIAGLGGQGVIKASDILADAAFVAGLDVKKSEIHGMSQRGGSVTSDVRFGECVLSPMVPAGEADCLLVLDPGQVDHNRPLLRPDGVLIAPEILLDGAKSPKDLDRGESGLLNSRNFNVAMLGVLSAFLELSDACWREAIRRNLSSKVFEQNLEVFALGRSRVGEVHGRTSHE
ncbi:MAG: indolepyruvate ferredoxin oxidoreductase, beta subunit [Candidatus Hydrogenedentes bacterium]|nr:indolepyruvate ferredoxin oxidoreductase, beta subunit [Candidatus Hydrogenedentota bacterium]